MSHPIQTDLSPGALARAIEENTIAYWLYKARRAGWELIELPDALLYRSGLTAGAFQNGVLRTDFAPEEADARIASILADFRHRGLPFTWYVGPGRTPADLGERLLAHGFTCEVVEPGMAADLHALREDQPVPAGLAIERIRDDDGARRFLSTNRAANEDDPDVSAAPLERFTPASYRDDEPFQLLLARLDGRPVATAQLLLGAGVAGIYTVATVPDARRKGIGAAVTLAALRRARDLGYRIGVLSATPMGEPVYRRLGFAPYCMLSEYEHFPPDINPRS
jgi:GNAT superfamily N-acetyltransferase